MAALIPYILQWLGYGPPPPVLLWGVSLYTLAAWGFAISLVSALLLFFIAK